MGLIYVLKESLELLKNEPKIFIPRIFTTMIYTVFIVSLSKLVVDIIPLMRKFPVSADSNALDALKDNFIILLIFGILVTMIDVIIYAMYPNITRDYREGRPVSLIRALKDALKRKRTLFGVVITGFISIIILFLFMMIFLTYLTALGSFLDLSYAALNVILYFGCIIIFLMAVIVLAIIFFFAIPVTTLENRGIIETMKRSVQLGSRHKKEVTGLYMVFGLLIFITMSVLIFTEFKGAYTIPAIIAFVIGRLFQALIYTYVTVVNPTAYLHLRGNNNGGVK